MSGPAAPRGPRCRTSADGQPPGAPGRLTLLPRPQAPRLTRRRSQRKDTRSFSLKSTFKRNKTRVLPRNVPSFIGNKNKEKEKHSHDCSKRAEPGGGGCEGDGPQLGVPAAPAPPWSPSPQPCSGTCGDEAVRTGRRHPELPGAESCVPRSVTGRAGGAGDAAATRCPEPPSETKQPVPGLAATSVCPLLLGTRPRPGPLRRASERDVPVSGASRDDPLRANGSTGGLWGGRPGPADCPSASLPLRLSRAPKPKVKAGGGVRGQPLPWRG